MRQLFKARLESMLTYLNIATDLGKKPIPNPRVYLFETYVLDYLIASGNIASTNKPDQMTLLHKELIIMPGNARSATSQAKDMGSRGGKVGGKARANKLTTQQRSAIASKGAIAKNKKQSGGK